jgi:hypothetical protein
MRSVRLAVLAAGLACMASCAGDMPVAPRANIEVTGVIRDQDGVALNGVYVYFMVDPEPSEPPYWQLRTFTAPDGTFRGEVPEGHYRIRIQPRFNQGLPDVDVPFTVSEASTHFEHRYSGVLVSGTASGPGGLPLNFFFVSAFRTGPYEAVSTQAEGGTYQILLRPGRYDFGATSGLPGLPTIGFEVNIPDQDTTIDLDLGGHEVRVQVNLFGVGMPRTYVAAFKPDVTNEVETDLQGEAVLYLPSGTYGFRVDTSAQGITTPLDERTVEIQGDVTIPVDLSGVRWNGTVRRTGDLTPVPYASVFVQEIGSDRYGNTSTDASGRFEMIVRPDVVHNLWIQPGSGNTYFVNGIASSSDSTFDVPINIAVP